MELAIQPAAGTVVAGYRLERRLGQGGMSEVWAGVDPARQRTAALKVLLPQARANAEIVARFRREAELLGRIDSDHVPHFYAFLEQPEGYILVEEFIEGELLAARLEQRRLDVDEAIALGTGLARAVVELHRAGIVHRDLKPGNVILRPQADGGHRAVLIDLGVSRLTLHTEQEDTEALTWITQVARAVGTIPYMAPEQFVPSSQVTEAIDLYALGAILFRAVSGHHVFADLPDLQVAHAKLVRDAPRLQTPPRRRRGPRLGERRRVPASSRAGAALWQRRQAAR
jgi:serine/threonine-protein kinase